MVGSPPLTDASYQKTGQVDVLSRQAQSYFRIVRERDEGMTMNTIEGEVSSRRMEDEKRATVLRITIIFGDEQIPIEMRGQEVHGIVEVGHRVAIDAAIKRDPDGVLRPKELNNLTTGSRVTASQALWKRIGGIGIDLVVATVSGGVSTWAVALLLDDGYAVRDPEATSIPVALLVGLFVAVLVFILIQWRRRRLQTKAHNQATANAKEAGGPRRHGGD